MQAYTGFLPVLASIRQCDAPLDARRRPCGNPRDAYTFDVAYRERRWQVCRYLKGNYGSVD